jgi:hypothetical protein
MVSEVGDEWMSGMDKRAMRARPGEAVVAQAPCRRSRAMARNDKSN